MFPVEVHLVRIAGSFQTVYAHDRLCSVFFINHETHE